MRVASMATMVYARAETPARDGAPWRLHVANAGHPPVLLRAPDGAVRLLDGVTGMLVGVDDSSERTTLTLDVRPGTTLIAYTDGLIERPGTDLDQGIHRLCQRLGAPPPPPRPPPPPPAPVPGSSATPRSPARWTTATTWR